MLLILCSKKNVQPVTRNFLPSGYTSVGVAMSARLLGGGINTRPSIGTVKECSVKTPKATTSDGF